MHGPDHSSEGSGRKDAGGVRALLGDPGYLRIWGVGVLTGVVRWLQLLVLGIYTFEVTGSPLLVSIVPVMWMLPLAVCGPLVGVLAERLDRRALLSSALAGIMAVSAAAAVIAHAGALTFPCVAAISLLGGLFWTVDMPVRRRLMGDLAGASLSAAMSLDSATSNATRMAGPLLGGVILQGFNIEGVFVSSAALFALAALLAWTVRTPRGTGRAAPPAFLGELAAGIRFVLADRHLRRILAVTVIFNIWGFPFTAMIPILGKDQLGLAPVMVGALSGGEGLGAFIGAVVIAVLAKPVHFERIYVLGTTAYLVLVAALGMVSYAAAGGPALAAAITTVLAIGLAGACFAAMQSTLIYLGAPAALRSRVLGVLTLCIGTGPLGFFNVGAMAQAFGVSAALLIMSAEGLLALIVLGLASRGPGRAHAPRPALRP